MTNGLMMPTACGSGLTMLSEYCVAMAAASLARGRSVRTMRAKFAYPPPCAKIAIEPSTASQVQRKAASPDETCRDLFGDCSAIQAR
jgi:hypothetical protein